MKCIETECSSFYFDPTSRECVLGELMEPWRERNQSDAGITVYRKKDLKELEKLGKKKKIFVSSKFKTSRSYIDKLVIRFLCSAAML